MKGFIIVVLIFWIVSKLLRKNVYINTFNSFQQPRPQDDPAAYRRPEGEMTIEKKAVPNKKKDKHDKDDDGEFVDYIEVK
jgi:hypothetical protein